MSVVLDHGGRDSLFFLMNKKVGIHAESRRKRGREMNLETVTNVRNSRGEDREKQLPGCRENGSGKARPQSQRLCKLLVCSLGAREPGDGRLVLPQASHTESSTLDRKRVNAVCSPWTSAGKQAKWQLVAIVTKVCLSLCSPRDCSTPGSSVLQCLPERVQIHVH